jgi:hypothetical protein
MTDQHEIIVQPQSRYLAPAATIQEAIARYELVVEFTKKVMKEGKDYGPIPGTDKPTLLKPGAEKLSSLFGLNPVFEVAEKDLDWTGERHGGELFFYFQYRCSMYSGSRIIAQGLGSCNSFEKKYRYRNAERTCPACGKATIFKSKQNPEFYCWAKRGGCGATFSLDDKRITEQGIGQIKNPDPADIVNTIDKMAQKRALIAATLIATNASEYFTQDLDDFIEGKVITETTPSNNGHKVETTTTSMPAEQKPQLTRPYPPETVKEAIDKKASHYKNFTPTEEQVKLLRYGLSLCFVGDENAEDKRHSLLNYLTGHASTKEIDGSNFKAIVEDWLKMKQDKGSKEYTIDPMAAKEAQAIVTSELKDEGQLELTTQTSS